MLADIVESLPRAAAVAVAHSGRDRVYPPELRPKTLFPPGSPPAEAVGSGPAGPGVPSMDSPDITLEGVARTAGHLLLGGIGTAALTIVLLRLVQPLRPAIYHALYLPLGPWGATAATTVIAFTAAALAALGVPPLVVEAFRDRDRLRRSLGGFAGLLALACAVVVAAAYVEVLGFVTLVPLVAAIVAGAFAGLRRLDAPVATHATLAGGLPILALALLLLGFGLGWGGGYYLTAEAVSQTAVNGTVADFDEVPEVRDDLFDSCERFSAGVCRLQLRGYEHEERAARFLDRHGVRCPYRDAAAGRRNEPRAFYAVHDGTYYRVTCVPYGD